MTEPDTSALRTFAQDWFDALSHRAPVEQLLGFVVDDGLRMAFPEGTLLSHADVEDWYAAVGRIYTDQTHTIERFLAVPTESGTDVTVTVVWTARQLADDERLAFRVDQAWKLTAGGPDGKQRIADYQVGTLTPIPV
ncbi:hypothetical protein [Actinacidiphila acididurans]|uniref:Nuclear transport factor 2 family protein n=1 Tax=Actinacidiphila acididurans TaxID=2784346 RepID=A0ABS2TVU9_9ACTN|nr:hypothetical protein [Actinacidiphila acididurans]MBM9507464.1 hypothetical protein [Actinacidiphila acididurans]